MKTPDHIARLRTNHHAALEKLFPGAPGLDTWRRLRRIETRANSAACAACNGQPGMDAWPAERDRARRAVAKLRPDGKPPRGFFINGDPRGYALKIDPDVRKLPAGMHKDWGGYGILAPEID